MGQRDKRSLSSLLPPKISPYFDCIILDTFNLSEYFLVAYSQITMQENGHKLITDLLGQVLNRVFLSSGLCKDVFFYCYCITMYIINRRRTGDNQEMD